MYRIVGLQEDRLRPYLNQQVEVRGVMESSDTTATAGTTAPTSATTGTASATGKPTTSQPATTNPATGTSGTTAAEGTSSGSATGAAASVMPSFRASSIRVISANCSGGTN
jgi:hypothetical protein